MPDRNSDYYPSFEDGPRGGPPPGRGPPPPDKDGEDKEEGDYETFLVSKAALGSREVRPGDTVTMRVEHVYDDEVEMCPADSETETKPEGPSSADEELDTMGQEGE